MRNKTFRAIGGSLVLIAIGVAAATQIGPGEPSAQEMAAPTGSTVSVVSTTAGSATEPFEYRVGLLAGVSTANFWQYVGEEPTVWNAYVLGPTKSALYGIDPGTNSLIPDLAEAIPGDPTWDADGWRVRIDLETDLAWSDGQPVTASDIAFTFETVRRLGLGGGWSAAFPPEVAAVVAESPSRLRVEFTSRPSLQIWPYGIGLAPIMPAHVWSSLANAHTSQDQLYGESASHDVSGGPLRVGAVDTARVESTSNPGYPAAGPEAVTYIVYRDEAEAVAALNRAEIDTVLSPNGISPESVEELDSRPGVAMEKSPANSVRYVGFNLGRDPMSDGAFRQALALLVDREAATQSLVPDASAAYTLLTAANRTWFDEDKAAAIADSYTGELSDRLSKAISALEEAGYRWSTPPSVEGGQLTAGSGLTIDGRSPAPVTILTPGDEYDPARPDYTQRIEATLDVLGFDARPVITDFDTVVDLAFSLGESGERQYDMYVLGWTLGNPALPDYYRRLFASDGMANSTGYSNPQFDSTLARYEKATEPETARAALWEMEAMLAADLPYLVLYHPEIVEAYRSDRVGFESHALLGGIQGRLGGIADLIPAG